MAEAPGVSIGKPAYSVPSRIKYADATYWDERYQNHPDQFDWFHNWNSLRRLLREFLKKGKPILHVGCGNSDIQEGLAKEGYNVVNTDISQVVIDQMKDKHAHMKRLSYHVSDCRNMPEFFDCQYGSAIDKGTVDGLLCCGDGVNNVLSMFAEIARVLVPGGNFVLVTLGDPASRLGLLCRPEYGWSVSVCVLPRTPNDPVPVGDDVEVKQAKPKALKFTGPYLVKEDLSVEGLAAESGVQGSNNGPQQQYFYAYICRKAPLVLVQDKKQRRSMPAGWATTARAQVVRLAQEMGLREDVTAKGKRTRRMPLSSYNAGLCDQGQEAYTAGSGSCPTSPLASRRPATATHRGAVTPADSAGDAASETVGASAAWGQSEAKASGLVDASGPETAGLQLRCKSAKALTMPDMNSSSDSPIADGAGQPSLTALSSALPGLSYGRRGGGEGLSSIPLGTPSALSGAPATSTHGMASHALGSHALDVSVEADEDLVEVLHEAGRCTHSFPAAASPGPRDQSPLGASNLRPAALAAKDVSTVATHHRFASFSSLQETISDGDAVTDLSRPDSAASHAHSPLHSSVLGTAADDVAAGLGALQILEVSSNEDAASDPAAAEGANGVSSSAEGGLDEEQDMVFVPAYDRQSADRRLGQLRSNYERRSLDLGCHDQSVAYYAGRPSLQLTLPTHWEAPGAERAAQQDDSNC